MDRRVFIETSGVGARAAHTFEEMAHEPGISVLMLWNRTTNGPWEIQGSYPA